jgi:hypothetical protein
MKIVFEFLFQNRKSEKLFSIHIFIIILSIPFDICFWFRFIVKLLVSLFFSFVIFYSQLFEVKINFIKSFSIASEKILILVFHQTLTAYMLSVLKSKYEQKNILNDCILYRRFQIMVPIVFVRYMYFLSTSFFQSWKKCFK